MNPLKSFCLMACLVAAACASPSHHHGGLRGNSLNNALKPTEWLSVSELEALPAVDEITLQHLESISVEDGADLVNKIYHLSQIERDMEPTYVPNPSEISVYVVQPDGQKVTFKLDELVDKVKELPQFGDEEVIILITGLPKESPVVSKANRKLVQALMQHYNIKQQREHQQPMNKDYDYGGSNKKYTESNEDYDQEWKSATTPTGDIIVIDLGSVLTTYKRILMLDVEKTGRMFANIFAQLADKYMPQENIHIVAQGISAHVAGSTGRQFTRLTGHKLRRITALDPSKIPFSKVNALTGLARGDAKFVDAIHTSAYGMGTVTRVGNVDFYPNGPSEGVPGAKNIIEASMRATRYFAESVRPGHGHDFPAVAATSLKQYKNNDGYGTRTYMGYYTDYDLNGDYLLQVNSNAPFGKSAPARKQNSYHEIHTPKSHWDVTDNA